MRFGINEWIPARLQQIGISEMDFQAQIDIHPCYFGYFDYSTELESMTVPYLKKMQKILDIPLIQIIAKVTEEYEALELSKIVRSRREMLRLSVEELAERIGYSHEIVLNIESGLDLDNVCLNAIRSIASVLMVPFDLLLSKL